MVKRLLAVLNDKLPGAKPPHVVLRGTVIVGFMHFAATFFLSSALWISGSLSTDVLHYSRYRGLIWLVADNWQAYLLVLMPLSLMAVWRGKISALRMLQSKKQGLWIFIDISLGASVLLILFITGNMIKNGFFQSLRDVLLYPLVMSSYVLMGCFYGILTGIAIYMLNLLWVVLARPVVSKGDA